MRWLTAACVKRSALAAAVKLLNSAAFEKVSRPGSCRPLGPPTSIAGHLPAALSVTPKRQDEIDETRKTPILAPESRHTTPGPEVTASCPRRPRGNGRVHSKQFSSQRQAEWCSIPAHGGVKSDTLAVGLLGAGSPS